MMTIGEMYEITRPFEQTDSQNGEKLHHCDRKKVEVQEVLELVKEDHWKESEPVEPRVVDSVCDVVGRGNDSRVCDRSLNKPHSRKQIVTKTGRAGHWRRFQVRLLDVHRRVVRVVAEIVRRLNFHGFVVAWLDPEFV